MKTIFYGLGLLAVFIALDAKAGSALQEYKDRTVTAQSIATVGDDVFGDQTNLQTGATTFNVTDISVSTNSGLPMSVGRRLDPASYRFKTASSSAGLGTDFYDGVSDGYEPSKDAFGKNWELDIPFIRGSADVRRGWVATDGSQNRCSQGFTPPNVQGVFPHFQSVVTPANYWRGITLNIPGMGNESVLSLPASNPRPNDGVQYFGSTQSDARISCLSSLANPSTSNLGEGFVALLPNGTKYFLNWMARRRSPSIVSTFSSSTSSSGPGYYFDPYSVDIIIAQGSTVVPREDVFLYATRVEDRFGNFITYQYDQLNPFRLNKMTSSDGAVIDFSYSPNGRINSISSGNRVWTYVYDADAELSQVILPDGSRWSYDIKHLSNLQSVDIESFNLWSQCVLKIADMKSSSLPGVGDSVILKMTSPSGAQGAFGFRKLIHGTNRTPGFCSTAGYVSSYIARFPAYENVSLYEKTITGSGLVQRKWIFEYFPSWSWVSECPTENSCAKTSETKVTDPLGYVTRYKIGNDFPTNAGRLQEKIIEESGVVKQRTLFQYGGWNSGVAFPQVFGVDPHPVNNPDAIALHPTKSTEIIQDGVSFLSSALVFDQFARVVNSSKSSTLGFTRLEAVSYRDFLDKWVLGLELTRSVNGTVSSALTYDSNTTQLLTESSFGILGNTYSYNMTPGSQLGNVATVTDARGGVTRLDSWRRGVPQLIVQADGKTQSSIVNDWGWIQSTQNQLGDVTGYLYDSMGRISKITPPVGDTVNWNPTVVSFSPNSLAEFGLAAGHWKQTTTTGAATKTIYFDASWRPILSLSEDRNDVNTKRYVVKRYDALGREVFSSYPVSTLGSVNDPLLGVKTTFDALNRVIRIEQDSERGTLTTSNEHLSGFRVRETNPRGKVSTKSFQAFDTPSYESPVLIVAPEGVTTEIVRDVFGKPISITRSGPSS